MIRTIRQQRAYVRWLREQELIQMRLADQQRHHFDRCGQRLPVRAHGLCLDCSEGKRK